uniref:Peptidase n=1 Tax=viral metagenome TaxID=1070528 RepID=A0A6M3KRT0_9ZZZZ
MKFAGFGDWVEIFRGGKQVDSEGREHDGNALIAQAVASFNAGVHEPPAVIGHPKTDDPAYGWVSALSTTRKDGVQVLLAKFRDVAPGFAAAVEQGLFKKRSAAFYPDGRLRHVGFLGAAPPAVKGLANLNFKDDGAVPVVFEFTHQHTGGNHMFKDFAEFFEFLKFWEKKGQTAEPAPATPSGGPGVKTFTEAELEAAKNAAAEAAKKEAEKKFSEQQTKDAASAKRKAQDQEISQFCDQLVKEGKIPPSWGKSGLVAFMQKLDAEGEIEFAEGAEKKTPLAWFKEFLGGFGKSGIFTEIATKAKAGDSADFAEAKQDEAAAKRIAAKAGAKFD